MNMVYDLLKLDPYMEMYLIPPLKGSEDLRRLHGLSLFRTGRFPQWTGNSLAARAEIDVRASCPFAKGEFHHFNPRRRK